MRSVQWSALFLGRFGSMLGNWILNASGSVIIYEWTHNVVYIALYNICNQLPSLIIGSWIGFWVQKIKPQFLMVGADILRAVLLILPIVFKTGWVFLLCVFLITAVGYLFLTGQSELFSSIAGDRRDELWSGFSLLHSISVIVGPIIALLALKSPSTALPLWLDAVSFLVSAAAVLSVWNIPYSSPKSPSHPALKSNVFKEMTISIQQLKDYPDKWNVVILSLFIGIFLGVLPVITIPFMTQQQIRVSSYPLLAAMQGAAGIIASFASFSRLRHNDALLYSFAALIAVLGSGFFLAKSLLLLMTFYFFLYLSISFIDVVLEQRLNQAERHRGAIVTTVAALDNAVSLTLMLLTAILLHVWGDADVLHVALPVLGGITLIAILIMWRRASFSSHSDSSAHPFSHR
ncbi:MFS transporter [Alicyclobacillus sp. SO9]|uniref:MFS transporter n=1 Tax=Alicyclobacillus sp. SO9 TaxID=2665646 RepID=UPI0018E839F8|nr:MFS transporter [Alicyclobacillus sp. SO9]QQE78562.1 MFS transporter [Alicyclobacillus sp. SO9]